MDYEDIEDAPEPMNALMNRTDRELLLKVAKTSGMYVDERRHKQTAVRLSARGLLEWRKCGLPGYIQVEATVAGRFKARLLEGA